MLSFMCFLLSAVTKSLQRSARCPKKWGQRHHPIPAHLRSAPTKRGQAKTTVKLSSVKGGGKVGLLSVVWFSLSISVPLCFPHQAVHQAERVRQRQTEHLSFFIQHQQLQQHHRRNRSSGRTGDSEYNTYRARIYKRREEIECLKWRESRKQSLKGVWGCW